MVGSCLKKAPICSKCLIHESHGKTNEDHNIKHASLQYMYIYTTQSTSTNSASSKWEENNNARIKIGVYNYHNEHQHDGTQEIIAFWGGWPLQPRVKDHRYPAIPEKPVPEDHADKHNCAAVRESEESNDRSEEWSTDPEIEESQIHRMTISQMPISPHFYKFTVVMFQSAPNLIKTPPSAWTLPPKKVTTTKIYTISVVSSNQDAKSKIPSKPTSSWSQNLSTLLLGKPTIPLGTPVHHRSWTWPKDWPHPCHRPRSKMPPELLEVIRKKILPKQGELLMEEILRSPLEVDSFFPLFTGFFYISRWFGCLWFLNHQQ